MRGTITRIVGDRGFGFLTCEDVDYFFHASSIENARFDELREGQVVQFEEEHSTRGPRARVVVVDAKDAQKVSV